MHTQAYSLPYLAISWAVLAVSEQFLKFFAHTRAALGFPGGGRPWNQTGQHQHKQVPGPRCLSEPHTFVLAAT